MLVILLIVCLTKTLEKDDNIDLILEDWRTVVVGIGIECRERLSAERRSVAELGELLSKIPIVLINRVFKRLDSRRVH